MNKFKIRFAPICLLLLVINSFAQSPGCVGACENTYTDQYNQAWDNYHTVLSPPPGGVGECTSIRDGALAQAEINRTTCLSACQGTGTGTNPNNVAIYSSDLAMIKQENTSTGLIELRILSEESNFQQFSLQTTIPIASVNSGQWNFGFGIYNIRNRRPDLFCIKKTATGSGMMEVHVLSGQSDYQSFLTQRVTTLPVSNNNWDFVVGVPDTSLDPGMSGNPSPPFQLYGRIIAVQKNGTQSGLTEISILKQGVNNFEVAFSTPLPLQETDESWRFGTGDWDQDSIADLMAIHPRNIGSRRGVEIRVFSGASDYQAVIINAIVPFYTHSGWDFFPAQYGDISSEEPGFFGINKLGSLGSNILININYNASTGYQNVDRQNLISPLAPDPTSVFVPTPSYDCSGCPD